MNFAVLYKMLSPSSHPIVMYELIKMYLYNYRLNGINIPSMTMVLEDDALSKFLSLVTNAKSKKRYISIYVKYIFN